MSHLPTCRIVAMHLRARPRVICLAGVALAIATGCSELTDPRPSTPPAPPPTTAPLSITRADPAPSNAGSASNSADSISHAPPSAAPETPQARDPFAGVDASQHDVLRNIARINVAAPGVRPGATDRPRPARAESSVGTTAAPTTAESSSVGARPAPAAQVTAAPTVAPATTPPVVTAVPQAAVVDPPPIVAIAPAPIATPIANPGPAADTTTASVAAAAPASDLRRRALAQPRPVFPIDAARDGYTEGRVIASLAVGADGTVRNVAIVSSTPSRSFGRAASTALRDWRYEPAAAGGTIQVELVFRLD